MKTPILFLVSGYTLEISSTSCIVPVEPRRKCRTSPTYIHSNAGSKTSKQWKIVFAIASKFYPLRFNRRKVSCAMVESLPSSYVAEMKKSACPREVREEAVCWRMFYYIFSDVSTVIMARKVHTSHVRTLSILKSLCAHFRNPM